MDIAQQFRISKLSLGANRLSPYGRRSRFPNRQKIAEHAAPINLISMEGTAARDFVPRVCEIYRARRACFYRHGLE